MALLSNINDKFAVDSTGAIQFNGQVGTSGYVLKSNANAAPTWVDPSTVIGGPYLPLTGGTLTGATATASGISFTVGGDLTVGDDINISGEQLTFTNDSASAYIRAADALLIQSDYNTGENKPIYLQPSAVTELTIATGISTFAGNVLIGTNINSSIGLQVNQSLGSGNAIGFFRNSASSGGNGLVVDVTNTPNNYLADFRIGNSSKLRIDSSGKVGIGTNGPVRQLDVAGITKTNGLQIKRNYIEQQTDCAFANGVANQNIDIRLGNISFWGYIEVEITGTYSNQNTPGKLTKVYAVGVNPNGTIYANNPRVVDALGPIKNNIALGAFSWDSTNSTYTIRVSHIVSTGNNYTIKLKAFTHGSNGDNGAAGILSNFTLSTVYTATSLSQNYVYYDNAVGIGTDLPQSKFQVAYQGNANGGTILMGIGGSGTNKYSVLAGAHYNQASGSGNGAGSAGIMLIGSYATNGENDVIIGGNVWEVNAATTIRFYTHTTNFSTNGGTEKMRITSGGDVLFGTQGTPNGTSVYGSAFTDETSNRMILRMASSTTGAVNLVQFYNGNGLVGKIQTNGFATSYIASSDYRLKENVVEMTGALDRVSQLKPSRFNFIADADKTVDGFLAHEVQKIVPEAITGEKDAVDEDGNPEYQGIDQSKLVPLLVGAIKELEARVKELENK